MSQHLTEPELIYTSIPVDHTLVGLPEGEFEANGASLECEIDLARGQVEYHLLGWTGALAPSWQVAGVPIAPFPSRGEHVPLSELPSLLKEAIVNHSRQKIAAWQHLESQLSLESSDSE